MVNFLDRNNNTNIIIAGIISLIVSIGVARFSFTSMLPMMLNDTLELSFAGILTSIHYIGYLCGAIFSIFLKDINAKVRYFKVGILLCAISVLFLGINQNEVVWIISRALAGFGSSMTLIIGGAIVMDKLNFENTTKAMGIHYSGVGFSIVVTDLIIMTVLSFGGNWKISWVTLTIFALLASLYSIYILAFNNKVTKTIKYKFDKTIFTPFVILIALAYLTQGAGFVVHGTFLPDIINSIDGLHGYGNKIWTILGVFSIPSCIIWLRLAHKYGSINIIIIASSLEAIGILIPSISTNIYLNILGAILYGTTMVGLVGLFLNLGGKIAKKHPVILMGSFTSAYAIGQITAPLYSVALVDIYKNYDYAIYLTSSIVSLGIVFLLIAKNIALDKKL